jgi:hypothetical protein
MFRFLKWRVMSEASAERFAWVVGFGFLVVCTTLMLKMFPELPLLTCTILVGCVSAGWLVIGWEAGVVWRRPKSAVTTASAPEH